MRISDWSSDVCSSDLKRTSGGSDAWRSNPSTPDPRACIHRSLGIAVNNWSLAKNDIKTSQSELLAIAATGSSAISRMTPSTDLTASARSEEHTSELQSLMRISYAVFCLKKKMT